MEDSLRGRKWGRETTAGIATQNRRPATLVILAPAAIKVKMHGDREIKTCRYEKNRGTVPRAPTQTAPTIKHGMGRAGLRGPRESDRGLRFGRRSLFLIPAY